MVKSVNPPRIQLDPIYTASDGHTEVEFRFKGETLWLNRQQLSVLFDRDNKTIGKHINNIFNDNELDRRSVIAEFATTAMMEKYIK